MLFRSLKYSINKGLRLDDYRNAVHILHNQDIRLATNIIVGAPFLSASAAIDDATRSVRFALELGSDECYIFPINIKTSTPLASLYNRGLYFPPSLWSLVEVLKRIKNNIMIAGSIKLSWYKSYGAYNVIQSPTTCPLCYDKVIGLLDKFAEYGDYALIEKLTSIECVCKDNWNESIRQEAIYNPVESVLKGYELLANEFFGSDWWQNNKVSIKDCMLNDLNLMLRGGQVEHKSE